MSLTVWVKKELVAAIDANRGRWPFALPVCMGGGIGLYFLVPTEPGWAVGPVALAAAASAAFLLRGRGGILFLAALTLSFAALGFAAASLRTLGLDGRLLAEETPTTVIEGRILELEPYHQGSRVILDRVRIAAVPQSQTPYRVRIRLRGAQPDMRAGDWIRLRGRLSAPSPPLMPGGFDFQRHAYFTGIGAVGFSMGSARILDGPPPGPFDWRIHLSNLRAGLAARVTAAVPGDAGAVAAALITGFRSLIPDPVLDAFRDAGLAHLLAISGLHIGLAAGIVFLGARRILNLYPPLAQRLPVKKIAALFALFSAFGYALMAGATVPTQRAFLIAAMVLVAVMADRRGISLRMLAWGATVVLLFQPESLLGPSFQMSFAAAIALVAAYEWARERGIWRRGDGTQPGGPLHGVALYALGVAFTTVVASLATAPFVLYHFNQVARFGLIANLIAVPVTALWVMPSAMLSFLLLPFGWEKLALVPMGWGTELVIRTAEWVAGLPDATEVLASAPAWALTAMALGGLWLAVLRGRLRLAGTAGIVLFAVAVARVTPPDLIVSATGDLAAVRGAGSGYRFSSLTHGRFQRENWLAHAGFRADDAGPWARDGGYGVPAPTELRCDGGGCILSRAGWTVAVAETQAALAEDCSRVDLVIALIPARRICRGSRARVIDLFDLRNNGAHSITLGRTLDIQAVNDGRGDRPWMARRQSTAARGK